MAEEKSFDRKFGKQVRGLPSPLLGKDDLSSSINMRPTEIGWEQRGGMTELTPTAFNTGGRFISLFQFTQVNEDGDYLLAHTYDASDGHVVREASTLPPGSPITWANEYSLNSASGQGTFAQVVDAVIFAAGEEFIIWRGDQHKPIGVWWYSNARYLDYYDELTDDKTTTYLNLTGAQATQGMFVLSPQPANKIIPTMSAYNTNAATITVYKWNGAFTDVSATDNTASGGACLGKAGEITWTKATDEVRYIFEGNPGYLYKVVWSNQLATVKVTALDIHTPWGDVKNLWDGNYLGVAGAYVSPDGTAFQDYWAYVNNEITEQSMSLASLDTSGQAYLGFTQQCNYLIADIFAGYESDQAATITVSYMKNDGHWTSVGTVTDATAISGKSLAQGGTISWVAPTDEKPCKLAGDLFPLYWYKLTWSATLGSATAIYQIRGVAVSADPEKCDGVFGWQRRAWQIAPLGAKNGARYSAMGMPNTWNGPDSGYIYFGSRTMKAAVPWFEESLWYGDTEMYLLQGDRPATFQRLKLSDVVGTQAKASVIRIETGIPSEKGIKTVIAWIYHGIWFYDGIRWWIITSPDLKTFWDPSHDDYINPDYADRSYGAWHYPTQCAYWCVYSGSSQTTPNRLIVLHVPTLWFGIYELGTDVGAVASILNSHKFHLVAGGHSTGKFYEIETGDQDVNASGTATAIVADMVTKDIWEQFDSGLQANLIGLMMKSETKGEVELAHYPDGSVSPQDIGKVPARDLTKAFTTGYVDLPPDMPQAISNKIRFRHQTLNVGWKPYAWGMKYRKEETKSG